MNFVSNSTRLWASFSALLLLAVLLPWGRESGNGVPRSIRAKLERVKTPFDQPDAAARFYLSKREAPEGGDINELYLKARQHIRSMPRFSTSSGERLPSKAAEKDSGGSSRQKQQLLETWESLGPGNIGGRIRSLLIHPQQPSVMWAGGVSGGVWKSQDGGASWRPLDDLLPNIAVNSMVMDPGDPDVIYAGTGEGFFREVIRGTGLPLQGAGIFKTTDGGDTWDRLASTHTSDFHWVNDLKVSSNDSNRVYAATRTGVWRSLDGGETWQQTLAATERGGCLDLALRTDLPSDTLLAGCGTFEQATIYRNTQAEGGGAWTGVHTEFGMGRTSITLAPSNQDIVYALSASYVGGPQGQFDGGLHAVFRSDQGGAPGTWNATTRNSGPTKLNTLILSNPVIAHLQSCFGGTDSVSNLGWYTNMIAVDPTNPNVVWAGGVDLFRSDDGGNSWGMISFWHLSPPSAHADQHVIAFDPGYNSFGNQRMYVGGDGGIWRTSNARGLSAKGPMAPCSTAFSSVTWTRLNNNLGVTQFYDGKPTPDGTRYFGGTQDNGTLLGTDGAGNNGWSNILGGDGGYVAVDPNDPNVVYAESQFLGLAKSTNGGATFSSLKINGILESRFSFLFITPFIMDPNDSQRLWTGARQVWRTSDGAENWTAASSRLGFTGQVSALSVAPGNPDHALVGLNNGFVHRQDQALTSDGSSSWPGTLPRQGFVTWLTHDPVQPEIAYATYGGFGGSHVWKSGDGGNSWVAIDGSGSTGLPDVPAHSIVVDPNDRQRLYLGTDLGVFVSTSGGVRWAVENTGFANVVTESLTLNTPPGQPTSLWAFTHGRGAWRVQLGQEPDPCTPERWIVHVTPDGVGFITNLFATNFGSEDVTLTLMPYDEEGGELVRVRLDVPAGGALIRSSGQVFLNQDVSHFGICGSDSVSLSAGYRFTDGVGITAHVAETSVIDNRFLMYTGEWGTVFDGMALINLGKEEASVEAVLLDAEGAEVGRRTLNLALSPNAKHLAVLDAEFQGLDGDSIRIESSGPGVVLFLRGTAPTVDPMVLFQTQAIAVTPRQ